MPTLKVSEDNVRAFLQNMTDAQLKRFIEMLGDEIRRRVSLAADVVAARAFADLWQNIRNGFGNLF